MSETTALASRDEQLMALPADHRSGTAALALMTDTEFENRVTALAKARERVKRVHETLMDAGIDYGVIPGTGKATLLQPGAEKLGDFYHLAPGFHPTVTYGNGDDAPQITVLVDCHLHLGSLDGPVVCTGHGAATSWEVKYRYRRAQRACPKCGVVGTVGTSKYDEGGYFCNKNRGGCGATFKKGDKTIEGQRLGDVENADPFDLLNTLVKMGEKRAHVAAIRRATATSGLYADPIDKPALAPAESRNVPAAVGTTGKPPLSEAEDWMGRANRAYQALDGDPADDAAKCRDMGTILKKRVPQGMRLPIADWKKCAEAWEAQVAEREAAMPLSEAEEPDEARPAVERAEAGTYAGTLIDAPAGSPAQMRGA